MKTSVKGTSCSESDADRYAAYLETPEGRLRTDLTFANLQDVLPVGTRIRSLCALDLGCGPGMTAIRLAGVGVHVTLVDSSGAMLDLAERRATEAGLREEITIKHGDAADLGVLFQAKSFDIILCHNLLEYVDDPAAVLGGAARILRDTSATLSVLVRSQAGEVLKAAVQAGDLMAAKNSLAAEWGQESLYGGKVRLFRPESLESMLQHVSLTPIARRGVRVIADYLPATISRAAEFERIFALERNLGERPEFFGVARYMHYMARRAR